MIKDYGFNAETNLQNLNLPGYWITPRTRRLDTLAADRYTVDIDIYAIAGPAPDPLQALDELSTMQDALVQIGRNNRLTGLGDQAEVYDMNLQNFSADPIPAFRIEHTLEVT